MLPDIRVRWNLFSTPFGYGAYAFDSEQLLRVALPSENWAKEGRPPFLDQLNCSDRNIYFDRGLSGRDYFEAFFAEEVTSPSVVSVDWDSLAQQTTAFQLAVLRACADVPAGSAISYGELAERAGYLGCARAAGTVMATNPLPLIIPCHRILRSDGSVGQYGGGSEMKRFLLEREGALNAQACFA